MRNESELVVKYKTEKADSFTGFNDAVINRNISFSWFDTLVVKMYKHRLFWRKF